VAMTIEQLHQFRTPAELMECCRQSLSDDHPIIRVMQAIPEDVMSVAVGNAMRCMRIAANQEDHSLDDYIRSVDDGNVFEAAIAAEKLMKYANLDGMSQRD